MAIVTLELRFGEYEDAMVRHILENAWWDGVRPECVGVMPREFWGLEHLYGRLFPRLEVLPILAASNARQLMLTEDRP